MKFQWVMGLVSSLGFGCGAVCGNNSVEEGEVCDDGNELSGDGCEATCVATPQTCGNGVIDAGELCLGEPVVFGVGQGATDIITGDFNNDQQLDLAVAQGSIGILLGEGNQSFSPQVLTVFSNGDAANQLGTADFNLDGVLDLAVSNVPKDEVLIFFGSNGTQFTLQPRLSAGPGIRALKTAFLDGDNQPDLFVSNDNFDNTGTPVGLFFGQANGVFPLQQTAFLTGGSTQDVIATEVNGDGLLDLVSITGQATQTMDPFLNQGNQTFATTGTAFQTGAEPIELAAGDLDDDGAIDIVVANQDDNNVSVLLGRGDGFFEQAVNVAAGETPVAVSVADIDSNGLLDVGIVNRNANTVTLLLDMGSGTPSETQTIPTGDLPVEILLEDVNDDGAIDLVTLDANSNQVSIRFAAP